MAELPEVRAEAGQGVRSNVPAYRREGGIEAVTEMGPDGEAKVVQSGHRRRKNKAYKMREGAAQDESCEILEAVLEIEWSSLCRVAKQNRYFQIRQAFEVSEQGKEVIVER